MKTKCPALGAHQSRAGSREARRGGRYFGLRACKVTSTCHTPEEVKVVKSRFPGTPPEKKPLLATVRGGRPHLRSCRLGHACLPPPAPHKTIESCMVPMMGPRPAGMQEQGGVNTKLPGLGLQHQWELPGRGRGCTPPQNNQCKLAGSLIDSYDLHGQPLWSPILSTRCERLLWTLVAGTRRKATAM